MFPAIAGKTTKTLVRSVRWTLSNFSKIVASQGIPGLVQYLKAISVATQQSIAGYRTVTTVRVSRTKSGLPRAFPVVVRRMIRSGSTSYMRLALTLSSLYRDFIYDSPIKLSSITNPYTGNKNAINHIKGDISQFVRLFIRPSFQSPSEIRLALAGKFRYSPISKSSPQAEKGFSSSNPFVLIRSCLAMPAHLQDSLNLLLKVLKDERVGIWLKRINSRP
jgi:hypothetical protein